MIVHWGRQEDPIGFITPQDSANPVYSLMIDFKPAIFKIEQYGVIDTQDSQRLQKLKPSSFI